MTRTRIGRWLMMGVAMTMASAGARADVGAQMTAAAQALTKAFTGDAAEKLTFEFGAAERLNWHFIPRERKGVPFKEMNDAQRKLAHALIRTGLSKTGYEKATTVMKLESVLRQIEGPDSIMKRDPDLYYVTIFGSPAMTGTWGWRLEGHHLSLNYTVRDGRVASVTPGFFGANPAHVVSGQYEGLRTLAQEEDKAKALLAMLNEDQRAQCKISPEPAKEVSDANQPAPVAKPGQPMGISWSGLNEAQRKTLGELIEVYLSNFPDAVAEGARGRLTSAGMDNIHFGWGGGSEKADSHSYRVEGPTFLIEYVNKIDPGAHIHSYFRSMTDDFGAMAKK